MCATAAAAAAVVTFLFCQRGYEFVVVGLSVGWFALISFAKLRLHYLNLQPFCSLFHVQYFLDIC